MTMLDGLSWAAAIVLLYGLKLIGDKRLLGFYVATLAEVMWMTWGVLTHGFAIVVVSSWIIVMYARAIMLWEKEGT